MAKQLDIPQLKISRVSWSTLVLTLIIAFIFGLSYFHIYSYFTTALVGSALNSYAFLANIFLFTALGSYIWSRPIDGESSLIYPFFSLILFFIALILFSTTFLINLTVDINNYLFVNLNLNSTSSILFSRFLSFMPNIGLLAILTGGAIPLLTEMSLSQHRGLRQNVPAIFALYFLGLALGFYTSFNLQTILSLAWLKTITAIVALLAALFIILLYNFNLNAQDRNLGEKKKFQFWPTKSLGAWSGETRYGNEQSINRKLVKHVWLIIFFIAIITVLTFSFFIENDNNFKNFNYYLIYGPIFLALGALVLSNILNWRHNLIIALLFLCLIFIINVFWGTSFFKIINNDISLIYISAFIMAMLLPLGALGPIGSQIFQAKRGWVASSVGVALFYLYIGLFFGLILAAYFNLYNTKYLGLTIFGFSLIVLFLVITPIFTKIPALIISLILAFVIYQYCPPIYLAVNKQATQVEGSAQLNNISTPTENTTQLNNFSTPTENTTQLNNISTPTENTTQLNNISTPTENTTQLNNISTPTEGRTPLESFFTNYLKENKNINLNLYKIISTDNYFTNLETTNANLLIANVKKAEENKKFNYFKDDIFIYFTFSKQSFDLIVLNNSSFKKENEKFLNLTAEKLNINGLVVFILNKENRDIDLFNNFSILYPNAVLIELKNYTLLLNKSINFKEETNLKNVIKNKN